MSLVERALKKIQESRGATPPALSVPVAVPVLTQHANEPRVEERPDVARRAVREVRGPARTVVVDRAALRARAILPPVEQERQLAAQYRDIKRPLIANALGRGQGRVERGHLIMVASALPGEGKTFTSINLALSIALEQDVSVLLVDADVAKPHISGLLGLQRERGLLDVLRDDSLDIESVILPTDVPRLSILPAGTPSDTATELLASARMHQLAEHLGAQDPHRIVLFDSPPLLLTSESRVLANVVGQIAMVVRADTTAQQAVLHALDLLGEGKSIGLVLNQCDEQSRMGYYQYYGAPEERAGAQD